MIAVRSVLALLLPGFVAFYSLRYISPSAFVVMEGAFSKSPTLGIVIVVLFVSLAAGVVVGAVRSLLVDALQYKTGVPRAGRNYAKLTDKRTLEAFYAASGGTIVTAQLQGNMVVATAMLFLIKLFFPFDAQSHWSLYLSLGAAVLFLFFAHRRQLREEEKGLKKLLA